MAIHEPSTSSGLRTVTTAVVITSRPALLTSLILNPGSATSTITVYDNASAASGTVLAQLVAAANAGSIPVTFNSPLFAAKGLTLVISGTAATGSLSYLQS